jgi:hypothetical protein
MLTSWRSIFWTATTFDGAEYDETTQRWAAHIRKADGATRTLRPKHIVIATSIRDRDAGKFCRKGAALEHAVKP